VVPLVFRVAVVVAQVELAALLVEAIVVLVVRVEQRRFLGHQ
jgi:hypothetical protein